MKKYRRESVTEPALDADQADYCILLLLLFYWRGEVTPFGREMADNATHMQCDH